MTKRTATERNKQVLIHLLDRYEYTDRVDASAEISLLEYGVIRNPKTDHTIFAFPTYSAFSDDDEALPNIQFDTEFITVGWVTDDIDTLADDSFWSFTGMDENEYRKLYLTNDFLSSAIQDIISYWGHEDFGIDPPAMYDLQGIINEIQNRNMFKSHEHIK